MWYVEGNIVKVPKFGSTAHNITWHRDGYKAVYEWNNPSAIIVEKSCTANISGAA